MAVEVKICGLTRAIDAEFADAAGASYLGVIFAGGPRQRSAAEARAILAGRRARKVGVFGTQSCDEIAEVVSTVGLDVVQLHDTSDPAWVRSVRAATGLEVWAVVRSADGRLSHDTEQLAEAADALLVDTFVPGHLGGSGLTIPWSCLAEVLDGMDCRRRIVLAGGLTAQNVSEAIGYVSPRIVDVSSGVESAPGIKDHARVQDFLAAVRAISE